MKKYFLKNQGIKIQRTRSGASHFLIFFRHRHQKAKKFLKIKIK